MTWMWILPKLDVQNITFNHLQKEEAPARRASTRRSTADFTHNTVIDY